MDDDGSLGIRNWSYFNQPLTRNLGLQLMSTVSSERDNTNPLQSNVDFLHHHHHHRDCGGGIPGQSMRMGFMRDGWIPHSRDNKMLHAMQTGHHRPDYGVLPPESPAAHTLQMMQPHDPCEDEHSAHVPVDEPKKRSQGRPNRLPKPKKPKKVAAPKEKATDWPLAKAAKKNTGLVINGIDLDISGIPTPVCSCTGTPQQCYRWGIGGWQSACCTTNMSEYPLPMSTKRRGARIAGRKMSQGAFKKVLEKLAGEGYNLSRPIDLKTFWAKHGTNKFVTIR